MSRSLHIAVMWLEDLPFDDSVAEAPHATARRLELHARRARFGWQASSQRMDQNLRDVHMWAPLLPVGLQWRWDKYLRVPSMKKLERRKHTSQKAPDKYIYHLRGDPGVVGFDDVGEGECHDGGDCDVLVGGGAEKLAERRAAKDADRQVSLFRRWLDAALRPGMVISVRIEDGAVPLLFRFWSCRAD